MDPFEERILGVLKDGRPRDFHQLLEEKGFSHNTLMLHLNTMADQGSIIREKTPMKGPGRPKFTYSMPRGLGCLASSIPSGSAELVTLTFKGLMRLCRFQRGGRCRKIKGLCEAQNCPQIQKNE